MDVLTWVVGSSRASVLSGFVQAAAAMGASDAGDAESVAARFVDWLGKTSRPWLVVLDDLRDGADLRGLWPVGPTGRLLITTANPAAISAEHRALALPVPAFSTREAMNYLSGRLGTDPDQRSGAIDLVGDLGSEPIALAQASAVIASSGMSCRDYRQYFTRRQKQLANAGRAETSAAAVTWTFSAEYAEHLSPSVSIRSLVTLAALLDGHGIPGAVFTTKAAGEYLIGDGAAPPPDPQRSWNAVLSLKQAGLMAIDPPGTPPAVRISPVIQAAIRAAVPKDFYDRAARAAADALFEIWPRDEPRSRLAADLRSCAVSLRQAAGDVLWVDSRCHPLVVLAGQSMDSARLTEPAVAYWRELAADSERVLGSGSLETLTVSGYLGEALMAAGQAAEAVSWFRRVLDGRANMLGPDHPGAIAAKVSLGRALVAVGQPGDAVAILEEAVAGSELVCGADHARYPRRPGRVRRRGQGRGKARRGDPRVPALAGRPGAHSGPAASRHHDRQPGAGRRLPGGRPDQGRHLPVQAGSYRPGRTARLGPSGHTPGPRQPRIGTSPPRVASGSSSTRRPARATSAPSALITRPPWRAGRTWRASHLAGVILCRGCGCAVCIAKLLLVGLSRYCRAQFRCVFQHGEYGRAGGRRGDRIAHTLGGSAFRMDYVVRDCRHAGCCRRCPVDDGPPGRPLNA